MQSPLTARCGRTRSNRGKLFTPESIKTHEHDCPECHREVLNDDIDMDIVDLIGDESDGVFWGMYYEMGGY